MKIVTSTLEGIAGIEMYPIIGLLIFLVFFIILIIRVLKMNSSEVNEFSSLPFDSSDPIVKESNQQVK
jgi:hypothetical protein